MTQHLESSFVLQTKLETLDDDCIYYDESSIHLEQNERLSDMSGSCASILQKDCTMMSMRPSHLSAIKPKSDSEDNMSDYDDEDGEYVRPRENYATCPAHKCKDAEGKWTKWVMERLDDSQREVYHAYMVLVRREPILKTITQNNHLRFLNGNKWDAKAAFDAMMASEKYRIEKQVIHTRLSMIQHVVDLNYVYVQGADRVGRPLLWGKVKNFIPEVVDRESGMRFMCYIVDYICSQMTPNVDMFLVIMDLEDFGYKNFSLDTWKTAIEVSAMLFSQRVHKVWVLNSGVIFSMIYATVKQFLKERQKERIEFAPGDRAEQVKSLQKLIDLDQIPQNYGGTAPEVFVPGSKQRFPAKYK